jgi:hypothetical protein
VRAGAGRGEGRADPAGRAGGRAQLRVAPVLEALQLVADHWLGVLLADIDLDTTLVVVLGDHGEDLLDHGVMNHRAGLWDSTLHVPLVVAFGDRRVTLKLDARERAYVLPCEESPAFVRVDPDFSILAEIKLGASRSMLVAALAADPNVIGRVRAARALAQRACVGRGSSGIIAGLPAIPGSPCPHVNSSPCARSTPPT